MDAARKQLERRSRRARRNESGIVLILAMFVVLVLLVIVPQFRFSAHVERELAMNDVLDLQMEQLARAGIMRTQAALLLDLEEDTSSEDEQDPAGNGGLDGGAGGAGGAGGGSGAGSGSGGAADATGGAGNHVDSLEEPWATGHLDFTLGEEANLKTKIVVTDEDSKLNVLLLCTEDDDYRREWRGRFERCIDLMRDGQTDDLAVSDAASLLDRMEGWMHGERDGDELADPPLATGDWQKIVQRPTHAPLSLAEFCLVGGLPPRLLHGFPVGEGDDEKWLPGLSQALTVWSNVEYKEKQSEEDEPPADVSNDQRVRPPPQGVNNGRVNVNTAPVYVLKSLFPDSDVPYSAWDEYDEFRRDQLEEIRKRQEDRARGIGDEESDREKKDPGDDDSPAKYPFKTIDDLRKVDGFSAGDSSIPPAKWDKLASLLAVESNVFTITVIVATLDPPRRYYAARAVVWRRAQGGESAECLPIVPFERMPLSAVDLRDFAKELEDEEGYSYR